MGYKTLVALLADCVAASDRVMNVAVSQAL